MELSDVEILARVAGILDSIAALRGEKITDGLAGLVSEAAGWIDEIMDKCEVDANA